MVIYNIFTGGTIGSQVNNDGVISTDEKCPYKLIEMYKEQNPDCDIKFINREPYRILSENLDAGNLLALISEINSIIQNSSNLPDGIVITHGTDTLQFSAAVLSYAFSHITIPVLLVSSDYVLDDERANGLINYTYAIDFIRHKFGSGIFVSYCNKGGIPTIHYGTRLQPALSYSGDVASIEASWFMRYSGGQWENNTQAPKSLNTSRNLIPAPADIRLCDSTSAILRIPAAPGYEYPELNTGIKAVLHESYHSGTIPINDKLKSFALKAKKLNIPIFLIGLTKYNTEYETVEEYRKLGITALTDTALVAAYCKLWLAISNNLDINNIMLSCIANDTL